MTEGLSQQDCLETGHAQRQPDVLPGKHSIYIIIHLYLFVRDWALTTLALKPVSTCSRITSERVIRTETECQPFHDEHETGGTLLAKGRLLKAWRSLSGLDAAACLWTASAVIPTLLE